MPFAYLLIGLQLQAPPAAPDAAGAPPITPTAADPSPISQPPPAPEPAQPLSGDAQLAAYLDGERRYAEQLGQLLGKDLRRHWARYEDDERDSAEERAAGEFDDDNVAVRFGDYLEDRYRSRVKLGIIMFSLGFIPLGIGTYTFFSFGEGPPTLGFAAIGGAAIVSGAVVWGVQGVRLRRFREIRARFEGRQARLQWRGLAPLYEPRSRTHGLAVGFAF